MSNKKYIYKKIIFQLILLYVIIIMDGEFMEVRELTNEEFENFTKDFKISSLYQSVEYANTMKLQKKKTILLGLDNEGEIKATSLVLIEKINGFKYATAPRGFIADYEDTETLEKFTKLISKYLSKKHVMALKINPLIIKSKYNPKTKDITKEENYDELYNKLIKLGYYHLGYNNYFEGIKPRFDSIISINKSPSELFKSVAKHMKTKIKKANMQGIKIYKGSEEDLEYLYNQAKEKYPRSLDFYQDIFKSFSETNNADLYYAKIDTKAYVQSVQLMYQRQVEKCNIANSLVFKNREKENNKAINKKLYEENILNLIKNELVYATNLLREHPEGIVLASAFIIKHNKCANLFMDGYNSQYKNFNAKHLLIWKLIEKYSLEKLKKFDMGGISNFELNKNNNKFASLNEFRLNFGATGYEYAGDFEIKANKFFYFLYQTFSPITKKFSKKKKENNNDDKEDLKKKSIFQLLKEKKESNK